MSYKLDFDRIYQDNARRDIIFLPVTLHRGEHKVELEAQVDTGASCCIFRRALGESIGVEIESGFQQEINTVTGSFTTYGHVITVSTLGLDFESVVYFAAAEGFSRNVLGRSGWLDRLRLGIVYYDSEVYLNSYVAYEKS